MPETAAAPVPPRVPRVQFVLHLQCERCSYDGWEEHGDRWICACCRWDIPRDEQAENILTAN